MIAFFPTRLQRLQGTPLAGVLYYQGNTTPFSQLTMLLEIPLGTNIRFRSSTKEAACVQATCTVWEAPHLTSLSCLKCLLTAQ